MDHKTRELRRRNKQATKKRGELPEFEARGLGKRNKPHNTFPSKQCEHIEGGQVAWIPVRRNKPIPGEKKIGFIKIVKGGTRCPNTAISSTKIKCLQHLAADSE